MSDPNNQDTPVAWRWRYTTGKWNVQKNAPHWYKPSMPDVELQPLYSSDQIDRMRERAGRLAEAAAIASSGRWVASVSDCAPPRSKRDNPIKNARSIRLHGEFVTEREALAAAKAAIDSGWAINHILHRPTAKPHASFVIDAASIDQLARTLLTKLQDTSHE